MRLSTITSFIMTALVISHGADAAFIGIAARAGAVAGKAAKAASQAAKAGGQAVKAGGKMVKLGMGSTVGSMGSAIGNTLEKIPDPVKSGLTSGTTSGSISGSVGLGVGLGIHNKQQEARAVGTARRSVQSEKLYQREVLNRHEMPPDDDGPGMAPEGINQADWDRCYKDALKAHIVVTGARNTTNDIQLDGLPASCMPLNAAFDGDIDGGVIPEPCGSACLKYENMTEEDYMAFAEIFEQVRTM